MNFCQATIVEKPIDRAVENRAQKQIVAYTGDRIFQKATYRCCPQCKTKNCRRNGKDNKKRIRRRCKCGRSFVIDWKVWNLAKLFSEVFEDGFMRSGRQSSIQYKQRIWQRLIDDTDIQEYINSAIIEITLDKAYSDDAKDEYVFVQACIMADKKDCEYAGKFKDSWYFLLNKYDMDVTYYLEYYCYILIRKHNIDISKRQNLEKPLLRCSECGADDISTYGFNNNSRRRIKCNVCSEISIVRAANLISQVELSDFCHIYLENYTRDQTLIESITKTLQHNFSYVSKSKDFDRLMARQSVITYELKEQVMKAFIGIEILSRKKNLQKSYWNDFINALQLDSQTDSEGYLIVAKDTFYSWIPKHIDDLLQLSLAQNEEEYKFNNIEYEIAAHLHDTQTFYDWKTRSTVAFEKLQK